MCKVGIWYKDELIKEIDMPLTAVEDARKEVDGEIEVLIEDDGHWS